MDEIETEISKLNTEIVAIKELLEKDYEEWTPKEQRRFGNYDQLRKKEEQLRDKELEFQKHKTILLQRDQNQGITSLITRNSYGN
jgi:hypothetical protein